MIVRGGSARARAWYTALLFLLLITGTGAHESASSVGFLTRRNIAVPLRCFPPPLRPSSLLDERLGASQRRSTTEEDKGLPVLTYPRVASCKTA